MMERAEDRRTLAKEQTNKSSKWPRTDRRLRRIESVLACRQTDLTVVLENVHDPHNVSAVLRSCDATGILSVHTIYTVEQRPHRAYARTVSASAAKWINVEHHDSVEQCYQRLRSQGFAVLAASLSEENRSLYETDLTQPVGLVFGNEMRGLTGDRDRAGGWNVRNPHARHDRELEHFCGMCRVALRSGPSARGQWRLRTDRNSNRTK